MYGGSGIWPKRSNISSKMPSYENWISLFPSSTVSITVPVRIPSPKSMTVPGFAFFPGFTRVSQISFSRRFNKSTSIFAPVSFFTPNNLAGITFVSLITRQSPGLKYSTISLKILCCVLPVFLSSTKSLEEERSSKGSCAISSCGRSKLKSFTFIFLLLPLIFLTAYFLTV